MPYKDMPGSIWVVVLRDGGVLHDVLAFETLAAMHEAGYSHEDMIEKDWPHHTVHIAQVHLETED